MHKLILTGEIIGIILASLMGSAYFVHLIWLFSYWVRGLGPLPSGPLTPEEIVQAKIKASNEGWIHHILDAFDIFINACFRGQMDETVSARAWRASQEGKIWGIVVNHWLGWYQPQHGPKAACGDWARAAARVAIEEAALKNQKP